MITTEEYVVTGYVKGISNDCIRYSGTSKFEAFKTYKEILKNGNARIAWAHVRRQGTRVIDYKIIKIVKQDYKRIMRDWQLDVSFTDLFNEYDEEFFRHDETCKEKVKEFYSQLEQQRNALKESQQLSQKLFEEYYEKSQAVLLEHGNNLEGVWSGYNQLLEELHGSVHASDIIGFLLYDMGNMLFMEGLLEEGHLYMKEAEQYIQSDQVDDIVVYMRLAQYAFETGDTEEGIWNLRRATDGIQDFETAFRERNMQEVWESMKMYL